MQRDEFLRLAGSTVAVCAVTSRMPDLKKFSNAKMVGSESSADSSRHAYLETLEFDRQLEASDVGMRTLEQLDAAVTRFGVDYLQTPLARAFEDARAMRRYVVGLLSGKHTLRQRGQLYSIAGWLCALIGHVAFDMGEELGVVDAHSNAALHLADEVAHGELAAWVRGTQALAATYRGQPRAAVEFAQAGRMAAPTGSITAVRLFAQEARAYARLRDRRSAERCLAAAERSFDGVTAPPTTSIFSFDRPYLPFYAGTCYVWLRQPQRAEAYSREAIDLCDRAAADWPVARVLARADVADVLIQGKEPEGAVQLINESLMICADGRKTDPMRERLHGLIRNLKARFDASAVGDLEEQFRSVFAEQSPGIS
ncbi:MAG: hypothetical protein ACRD0K_07085 [Egibacteraceae bacterium]